LELRGFSFPRQKVQVEGAESEFDCRRVAFIAGELVAVEEAGLPVVVHRGLEVE
jgi:hypothetical protein